jgi:hypothetical protein
MIVENNNNLTNKIIPSIIWGTFIHLTNQINLNFLSVLLLVIVVASKTAGTFIIPTPIMNMNFVLFGAVASLNSYSIEKIFTQ